MARIDNPRESSIAREARVILFCPDRRALQFGPFSQQSYGIPRTPLEEEQAELLESLRQQLSLPDEEVPEARREACLELAAHLAGSFPRTFLTVQ